MKVGQFLKNYKKILLVSLIGIFVVLICSLAVLIYGLRKEIKSTNDPQLRQIYNKYQKIESTYFEQVSLYNDLIERNINVVSNLLRMEPEDAEDKAYLDACVKYLHGVDNVIIYDKDKNLINTAGNVREVDYTQPYYDELFKVGERKTVEVYEEGSDTKKTTSTKCGDLYILIQGDDTVLLDNVFTESKRWQLAERAVGLDTNSFLLVLSLSDNTIIYCEEEALQGQTTDYELKNRDVVTVDGQDYFVQQFVSEADGIRLMALTPLIALRDRCFTAIVVILGTFIFALIILVAYIICLREGELDPDQEYKTLGKYFLHSQTKRFKALAIVVGILVMISYLLFTSLNDAKFELAFLERESASCTEAYEGISSLMESLQEDYCDTYYDVDKLIGEFLKKHDDYLNKDGMSKLSDALNVKTTSVIDAEGNMVCTSSPFDNVNILSDPDSPVYDLKSVLHGKEGEYVVCDMYTMGTDDVVFATPWRDDNGVADGAIAVSYQNILTGILGKDDVTDQKSANIGIANKVLDVQRNRAGSVAFLVNDYGIVITDVETTAKVTNIQTEALQDGYCGTLSVGDTVYLAVVTYIDDIDSYMFVMLPANTVTSSDVIRAVMVLLLYIIIAFIMWYDGLGSKYHFQKRDLKIKDADEWQRTELNWDELTVGRKMAKITNVCIYVLSVCIVLLKIMADSGVFASGTITIIASGDWKNSFNGYSLVVNIAICCIFYTGLKLVGYILKKIECIMGDDGATFIRLFGSVVKLLAVLVCAYIVFTNFGVDAAAALASIGIVGFALTFGAQELIKDMFAGLCILFEGNFKVGDMLDINGDWYWIRSIGVRTTRVEAWGSVRVINNSQMTGIVNIQNASCCVNCDIRISRAYDINEVERIMREELPAFKKYLEADVSTPIWKGIQEVTAAGTVIRIRTYCPPLAQGRVGRALRAEVKRILDNHGIELAYEAIIVHTKEMDPKEVQHEVMREHFEEDKVESGME